MPFNVPQCIVTTSCGNFICGLMLNLFVIAEYFDGVSIVGIFTEAAARGTTTNRTEAKKKTIWSVTATKIVKALAAFRGAKEEEATAKAKIAAPKETLEKYAVNHLVEVCVETNALPTFPVSIQSPEGTAVTFVVQNRTSSVAVTPDQIDKLGELLGVKEAEELIETSTEFKFNPKVLENQKCMVALEKLLATTERKLQENGHLASDQSIIVATTKKTFSSDILERMVALCEGDPEKMEKFIEIIGSSITMFVQA